MLSDAAVREVLAEAESAFFQPVDDATSVGYWRGEFWGKLAISAARVCRYNGNAQLKQTLRESAYRVLSCQRADGYIGSYQNEDFVRPNDPEVTKREVGWACDWCWNIWCRKYTLWGLIELYDLLGDEAILTGARRLAELHHELPPDPVGQISGQQRRNDDRAAHQREDQPDRRHRITALAVQVDRQERIDDRVGERVDRPGAGE